MPKQPLSLPRGYQRRPSMFLGLIICCTLFVVTACSPSQDPTQDPEQTLHISIGASPQALDPQLISGVPALKVVAALFEPLLVLNPTSGQPEAALAQSWDISDDGLTYTFKLRPEAKWSDGSAITAKDIVFSWQRLLSPNMVNPYSKDFYVISGAEQFNSGATQDFSTVGVKALGPRTVEFTLAHTDPIFLARLTDRATSPVQPSTILKHAKIDDPVSQWTQPKNIVSNGPFILTDWQLNKIITVKKNPYYWDAKNVKLEKIYFYPIDNNSTAERMFRSGKLQLMYDGSIPPEKIKTYQQNDPDKLVITPGYATYYFDFNTKRPPFDNADVRRAFAYAVDRKLIIKRIAKAGQLPATWLTPPTLNYNPESPIEYNPQKAKEYLAKAGYPNGEGFPKVTLSFNTNDGHRKVSVALQQMWKKHLNIEVELKNEEWKVFLVTRRQHQFDIARDGSSGSFGDPIELLSAFTTGHEMNTAAWSNPKFDSLIAAATKEMNNQKRLDFLKQAEGIFTQEVPVIPIYYYAHSYLIAPEVKGMVFNSIETPSYKNVYIAHSN